MNRQFTEEEIQMINKNKKMLTLTNDHGTANQSIKACYILPIRFAIYKIYMYVCMYI